MQAQIVFYVAPHSDAGRWRWRIVKPQGTEFTCSGTFDTHDEAEENLDASKFADLDRTEVTYAA